MNAIESGMSESIEAQKQSPSNPIDRMIVKVAGYFGSKSKEVERFLRFAVVGLIGAIVDFGVLNILQATLLPPSGPNESLNVKLASGIAFTAAVTSNFIWNRYWTYPDSRSRNIGFQLFTFFVINSVGIGFRLLFVSSTYTLFGGFAHSMLDGGSLTDETINQIGSNISQGISMIVVMFWNFFANRYVTYNDVD
jgi:putative flippase GtrA